MGVEVLDDSGSPREAKVTGLRFLHIYANLHTWMQRLTFADENLLAYALFASSHGYIHTGTQVQENPVYSNRRRGTVIQRTGGQDGRTKSLILNGARTDITRELEIDGGRKRRGGSERARYIEERGGRRNLSRFNVEDRTQYRLVLFDNSGRERKRESEVGE